MGLFVFDGVFVDGFWILEVLDIFGGDPGVCECWGVESGYVYGVELFAALVESVVERPG